MEENICHIQLRPTREDDLPFVIELERNETNRPFVSQWSFDDHKSAIDDRNMGHWIIESTTNPSRMGYVIAIGLLNIDHEINLRRIVVSHKEQGIGRQALRAFHRKAFTELGASRIWLVVYPQNERARNLYLSEGYAEMGSTVRKRNIIMAIRREQVMQET